MLDHGATVGRPGKTLGGLVEILIVGDEILGLGQFVKGGIPGSIRRGGGGLASKSSSASISQIGCAAGAGAGRGAGIGAGVATARNPAIRGSGHARADNRRLDPAKRRGGGFGVRRTRLRITSEIRALIRSSCGIDGSQ
jgi:hypothetical protein